MNLNINLNMTDEIKNVDLSLGDNEELDDSYEDSIEESDEDSDDSSEDISENIISNEPIKKKRGRKCKPKDESIQIEKIQKKRGRKPKIKDIEENEKIPKKRGRKPKEKIYSVKELPKTFFEENKNETFILHLPIKTNDKMNDNNPLPNVKNGLNYSIYDEDMNNYKINNNNLLPTQFDLLDIGTNNLIFDSEKNDNYENIDSNYKPGLNTNGLLRLASPESNQVMCDLHLSHLSNLSNMTVNANLKEEDESKTNRIIKKNLKNIMYEFINANNNKIWPDSTNIYCWWCCHPFDGPPCAIPEYYKKEKFYVNGCFCNFNCATSYNFSKNDDNMWERYSLLNLMYKKLYNHKFVKINLAPPREILKIFGGYLSIEEFRENSLRNEKTYMVIKPPLISIIPKIEENISSTSKNFKNNYPLVNESILNKTQNNLKLKRNKPVTNPNSTLQSFMDLKII